MKDMKKNGFQTLLDELCEMRISQGLSKKVEPALLFFMASW